MKKINDEIIDVAEIIDAEQTKSNKEIIIVSAICTFVGILIGFFIGKKITNKNTLKKYNECYSSPKSYE